MWSEVDIFPILDAFFLLLLLQMWLTYAPIPNYTARYYNISVSDVDWFSISYFLVSLLMGLVSIYVLDTVGLKVSVSTLGLLAIVELVYAFIVHVQC